MTRLLVVEHPDDVEQTLVSRLRRQFLSVDSAGSKDQAIYLLNSSTYHAVILNLASPRLADGQGPKLCKDLHDRFSHTPLLLLTRPNLETKVKALEYGADDVVTVPYAWEELLARIHSLCRRTGFPNRAKLQYHDLTFDPPTRKVERQGNVIFLQKRESLLLELLMNNIGKVLTRTEIVARVWDRNADVISNLVDVHMCNLRRKTDVGYPTRLIHTIHGFGYKMAIEQIQV